MDPELFDVIIVGAGPAGLSAALVLGRARRRVAVFDNGKPRNAVSRAVRGFLSRDGTPPAELRRVSREQLGAYANVRLLDGQVVDATHHERGFEVTTHDGSCMRSRKLIVATGLVDQLPEVEGMRELYGRGVHTCPYCDGFEVRDQPLAVYGQCDARGGELALELTVWSRDLVLCTDGASRLSEQTLSRLARNEVQVRHDRINRLEARDGELATIHFECGPPLPRKALFLYAGSREASDLPRRLGSEKWRESNVEVGRHGRAGVPGLYVIGDASRDVLQVSVAVAEGTEAAICVNTELLREDLR
jgi:thioredoxin reductase